MVVSIASQKIVVSQKPFPYAIADPTMIPESDKGRVRNRAASNQVLNDAITQK